MTETHWKAFNWEAAVHRGAWSVRVIHPDGAGYAPFAVNLSEYEAHLIAAAPAMLAALQAARGWPWSHNAAITQDIEQLRATCLAYSAWHNDTLLPLLDRLGLNADTDLAEAAADDTCTACHRPSLDCSRAPCAAVIADRES